MTAGGAIKSWSNGVRVFHSSGNNIVALLNDDDMRYVVNGHREVLDMIGDSDGPHAVVAVGEQLNHTLDWLTQLGNVDSPAGSSAGSDWTGEQTHVGLNLPYGKAESIPAQELPRLGGGDLSRT